MIIIENYFLKIIILSSNKYKINKNQSHVIYGNFYFNHVLPGYHKNFCNPYIMKLNSIAIPSTNPFNLVLSINETLKSASLASGTITIKTEYV